MKLAAIDIGSNAIRFQVTNVITYAGQHTFKQKLEYVRFPLRLGRDVFKYNKIGPDKEDKFFRLMHAFKLLIDLYEVDDYLAYATSAMRESENGHQLASKVQQLLGLKIHIIDGNREAELINKVVIRNLNEATYLHIDVGGGSTELNLIVDRKKIKSKSFRMGSVRKLERAGSGKALEVMNEWIYSHVNALYQNVTAVGTGGNINKIYDLSDNKGDSLLSLEKVKEIREYLASFSLEERMNKLQLNEDRADVILPATDIYTHVMETAGCKNILVPDVGLKDGMMQLLYENNAEKLGLLKY